MYRKIAPTMITILLLISLAGCSKDPSPLDQATPGSGESQEEPVETSSATSSASNQQMLPIVSGKVASLQLDATASGTTQQIKVGEVMAITLESNPSTGYAWFATSSNPDILAQMGESQYTEPQPSTGTPLLGASGTETFFFGATEVGTVTLTLEYKRGFEIDSPEKMISLTVEVK